MAEIGRILVIDDSITLLSKVKERLAKDGYEILTTTNAVANTALLKGCDLVIIDFHMPGYDGAQVLQALKKAAVQMGIEPLMYLHTTDQAEAAGYKKHGFDGAFAMKGNFDALSKQVQAAFRMIKLRKMQKGG